jgi:hypothetical protein
MKYTTVPHIVVDATCIEKSEYFGKSLIIQGDYLVTIPIGVNGVVFNMPHELFDALFDRQYSCLQEFIDDKKGKYSDEVLDCLIDNWEK